MEKTHSSSLIHRISINMLLTGLMATLITFLLLQAFAGMAGNRMSSQAVAELSELGIRQLNAANRTQLHTSLSRERLGEYLEAWREGASQRQLAGLRDRAESAIRNAESRYRELTAIPVDPQSQRGQYLNAIEQQVSLLLNELLKPALESSQLSAAQSLLSRITVTEQELERSMSEFVRYAEARSLEFKAQDEQNSSLIMTLSLILIAISVIAAFIAYRILMRNVIRPIDKALTHLDTISNGDLTQGVDIAGCKEINALSKGLATMQAQLAALVERIKDSTESISLGAGEIAKGSEDLAARTEEQASALQQTAASMEQISSTVKHNAAHAQEADTLSTSAEKSAEQSGKELQQALQMMVQLSESSRQVQKIVDTIDGITFQTNILALNASVEAARAGEHGRGFAVVAQEVRTLASRSSEAAKEIRQIIGKNVQQITSSAEQAQKSGDMLNEMLAATQRVSSLMSEIASATIQQQAGIEQVSTAVNQMDAVTQQNAALVQESNAAAGSLSDQATLLNQLVARFTVVDSFSDRPSIPRTTALSKSRALPSRELEWTSF
ncbi:methyl-accepting chemotaxis protein [Halomonas salifodinae]|uniref:Methyl-accepting chemotaxis protein n=1 Tax=Halomonas salifodinae TaxID=438745 RepID=A0ABW2ESU0_9GAMM